MFKYIIKQILGFNGWKQSLCNSYDYPLIRPHPSNRNSNSWDMKFREIVLGAEHTMVNHIPDNSSALLVLLSGSIQIYTK